MGRILAVLSVLLLGGCQVSADGGGGGSVNNATVGGRLVIPFGGP